MELSVYGEELVLTAEERAKAREHWLAMMFAPSSSQLTLARHSLKAAPLAIQKAVTDAIVHHWRNGWAVERDSTPFD